MEFTDDELDTVLSALIEGCEYKSEYDNLRTRIINEIAQRKELAEFASDCGDSCKL